MRSGPPPSAENTAGARRRAIHPALLVLAAVLLCPPVPAAQPLPVEEACRAKLEGGRVPAALLGIEALGECVYDFLAFISGAERITTRAVDGVRKTAAPFLDVHMALFAERAEEALWRKENAVTEFSRRRVRERLAERMRREEVLVDAYIRRAKDRRRYHVDKVVLTFELAGEYDFSRQRYPVRARVGSDRTIGVFHGLCLLTVLDLVYEFPLHAPPEAAERMAKIREEKKIELEERMFVHPWRQGVYKPSWLFDDRRYEAYVRLWPPPAFGDEVAALVRRWFIVRAEER